jgi:hypothetical protein
MPGAAAARSRRPQLMEDGPPPAPPPMGPSSSTAPADRVDKPSVPPPEGPGITSGDASAGVVNPRPDRRSNGRQAGHAPHLPPANERLRPVRRLGCQMLRCRRGGKPARPAGRGATFRGSPAIRPSSLRSSPRSRPPEAKKVVGQSRRLAITRSGTAFRLLVGRIADSQGQARTVKSDPKRPLLSPVQ